jgi:hypothetical protein
MEEPYDSTSLGYLRRARLRLADGTHEALFYAAFELRCGIEAKLQEHLDVLEDLAKHKKKGWKIKQASHEIEKAFETGHKVIEYRIIGEDEKFSFSLFHTPVTPRTQKAAERLGELLHAMKTSRVYDERWWNRTRSFLIEAADALADINRGTLSGPILQSATHKGILHFFLVRASTIDELVQQHLTERTAMRIENRTWDGIPEHAQPFLNPVE